MTPEARERALDLMAGHSLTRAPVDNAKAVLLLQLDPELLPFVLERRARWLEWLTLTQRKWQRETRRPARARHHDSIEIRERYVRCG